MQYTQIKIKPRKSVLNNVLFSFHAYDALFSCGCKASVVEKIGNTSRTMKFEARKVIVSRPDISASAADVLAEPVVVCRAHGTCVTPKDCQRLPIEK